MTAFLLLLAAAGPPLARPHRRADQLDFVLLAADRPVAIRLHARSGSRPYDAGWHDWTGKLFDWFDRDGDGSLSRAEAARLLPVEWLLTLAQGGVRADRPSPVPFAALDRDKDGKVSRAELASYLRRNRLGPLTMSVDAAQAAYAGKVNAVLWKRLDADGDGKLSQAELAKLPALLGKLDENEDEQLSQNEISQESGAAYAAPAMARPSAPSFLLDLGGPALRTLPQALLRAYDRDKDGKLTQAEIGLDAKAFAALDANGDGKLDPRELGMLASRPPDLAFRVRVGALTGAAGFLGNLGLGIAPQRLLLLRPGDAPLARATSRLGADAVRLKLPRTAADLSVNPNVSFVRSGGRGFFLQQFDALKQAKAKGLTRAQALTSLYIAAYFAAADRDGDGTLTRKEFGDFLDLAGAAGSHALSVQAQDLGQGLFSVIDADGNGQLSIRELRTAWQRVKPLCKDGKALSRHDLPRRIRIDLAEGPVSVQRPLPGSGAAAARLAGPAWFQKMDANGDGDISPKEWLGSEEDFKRLDADGDGLISAAEARRADPTKK